MTPAQQATLEETLDRVPVELLRAALRRRNQPAFGFTKLNDVRRLQYKMALGAVKAAHHLTAEEILNNEKTREHVDARWDLYGRLIACGFKLHEITAATGHEESRIRYGLRQTKGATSE